MALATHMTLLRFFGLWKMFVYVGYCNEWPGVVIPMSNGCQPCCFGGKPSGGMKIPDGLLYAGEFIDVENGILLPVTGCNRMIADRCGWWHAIFCVERWIATRRVQVEGVVFHGVGDLL